MFEYFPKYKHPFLYISVYFIYLYSFLLSSFCFYYNTPSELFLLATKNESECKKEKGLCVPFFLLWIRRFDISEWKRKCVKNKISVKIKVGKERLFTFFFYLNKWNQNPKKKEIHKNIHFFLLFCCFFCCVFFWGHRRKKENHRTQFDV